MNVDGDVVHGDKIVTQTAGGDIVSRDKITTTTIITDEHICDVAGLPNPYLGLRSFTYAERTRYAGRERSIEEAVANLTTPGEQQVLLFITGASGSGKSSFAQAGLLPALEAHYARRNQSVRLAVFRPGAHPLAARDDALKQLSSVGDRNPARPIPVIIIDQFEELLGQPQPAERGSLFTWLAELPPFSTAPQHIIVTLRSDYLNELFEVTPLWEVAKLGIELRAMRADELKDAILRPLQSQYPHGEKRFEPALLERLAQDAAGEATYLPLLQVTLEELWKKGRLVLSNYGTLTDAIKQRANQVFGFVDYDSAYPTQRRSEADQAAILDLFLSLVNVSDDDDPRRDVRISRATTKLTPEEHRFADDLSRARLLSVEEEPNGETVNIIHESLIRNWDQLRQGVMLGRRQLRQRGRFEQHLRSWLEHDRSDAYLLLTPVQLGEARELDKAGNIALRDDAARQLLTRSLEHADAEHRRELDEARKLAETEKRRAIEQSHSNRRLRFALIGLGALLLAAMGTTGLAIQQGLVALSRQLAAQAQSQLNSNPQIAVLVALEAERFWHVSQATDVLAAAPYVYPPLHATLTGQTDFIWSIAWSPDGKQLASGSADKTIIIWDVATRQLHTTLKGHTGTIWSVAWSPDGKQLASGSADNTIIIWDVASGQPLVTLRGQTGAIESVAWSPDGKQLASGSDDKTIIIWDVNTRLLHATLNGHTKRVLSVAWSPDGKQLASGSDDQTIIIWDVASGQPHATLKKHIDRVSSVAWSPDGKQLASASNDQTIIIIWDVASRQPITTLGGHTGDIWSLAWSPDGKQLASGSADKTIIIWDVAGWQPLATLKGHTLTVNSAAWSADGKQLASGSADKTIIIWDMASGQSLVTLKGHTDSVLSAAWNPDGKQLASGSADQTSIIWDTASGQPGATLKGHTASVQSVAWSPDGKQLASGSDDQTIIIWDVGTGQLHATLKGHTKSVKSVAWSPDGKQLASGSADQTIIIWDVGTWQPQATLKGHTASVLSVAWSPDGKQLASGSADQTITIWDVGTWQPHATLKGHTKSVMSVAWSPDGRQLASGSADKTIIIWDVRTGQLHATLKGHTESVSSVAWSPDGKQLASGSEDKTIIWDVTSGQPSATLEGHTTTSVNASWSPDGKQLVAGLDDSTIVLLSSRFTRPQCEWLSRNLTWDEWRLLMPFYVPYHKTCSALP